MLGYDILLNAKESKFYNFLDKDNFTIKSILMYKVSYQMFLNVLEYQGHISNELYDQIKDSKYVLLSDTKSNVVIKVDENKKITNLYFLDIHSDLDILELSYNLPKLDKFFIKEEVRNIKNKKTCDKKKSYLKREINKITNLDKLNYLLCEWHSKKAHTIEEARKRLMEKLKNKECDRIYEILKGLSD